VTREEFLAECTTQTENHIQRLDEITEDVGEQAWFLTAPGSNWNPGQIVRHLVLSNAPLLRVLPAAVAESPKSADNRVRTTFMGRMIRKAAGPDGSAPPPKSVVPELPQYGMDQVETLRGQLLATIDLLRACQDRNLAWRKIKSPLMGLIKYNVYDALGIMVDHNERHIRQIEAALRGS
jgi:hypothetical protein